MAILTQASKQWATRPADERFTSLIELRDSVRGRKHQSRQLNISSRSIMARPADGGGLEIVGPGGVPVGVTNWGFGQVAERAAAPAGYLRTLPAELAADNINYGLQRREIEDVQLLLRRRPEGVELAAVNGPRYGRVWDSDVVDSLVARFGDGVTGDFTVPGEFGRAVTVTKENTTLYASDRDVFVFLADEKNRIELPNRRNGKTGTLARGFFVWNSEVGAGTLGIATFLFDYACSNRIVWGAEQFKEIRIRHTASAPDKFIHEVAPALERYSESATLDITQALERARGARVDNALEFLQRNRFSKSQATSIMAAHEADEGRPIETLWDVSTGITAHARDVTFQDARIELERRAGDILDMAS